MVEFEKYSYKSCLSDPVRDLFVVLHASDSSSLTLPFLFSRTMTELEVVQIIRKLCTEA